MQGTERAENGVSRMANLRCASCHGRNKFESMPATPPPCRFCGGILRPFAVGGPTPPFRAKSKKPARTKRSRPKPIPRVVDYHEYINSAAWRRKRRWALRELGYACDECGGDHILQVHHRHYQTLGREQLHDLRVLCRDCHGVKHENKYVAQDSISTQFRAIIG